MPNIFSITDLISVFADIPKVGPLKCCTLYISLAYNLVIGYLQVEQKQKLICFMFDQNQLFYWMQDFIVFN